MQALLVTERAGAVACFDVGMRLIDHVRVRSRGPHSAQEVDVRLYRPKARHDRPIILDLAGDEHMLLNTTSPFYRAEVPAVLAHSGSNDELTQAARSVEEVARERPVLDQLLELARVARVEVSAEPIDHYRKRWDAIGPEPRRPDESVFHFDELRARSFELFEQRRRRARLPHGDATGKVDVLDARREPGAVHAVPQQWGGRRPLPEGEADGGADLPVAVDELPPEAAQANGFRERHQLIREG